MINLGKKLKRNKNYLLSFLLGLCLIPFGYWEELGRGFVVIANSLIGLSAAFTAWWAYKTFAFNERQKEFKDIYTKLVSAEKAYIERFSIYLTVQKFISDNYNEDINQDYYLEMMKGIEIRFAEAEKFLDDLFYSPFVSDNFNAQALLKVRVNEFENASDVQKAFFDLKMLLKKEFKIPNL